MTDQYEALRAVALGQPPALLHPQGLAILIRRGLPAWLAAWARCLPPGTGPREAGTPHHGAPLPEGAATDLVLALAAMALAPCREVQP